MNKLLKSKTFWTGVTAVISALAGYSTGSLDLGTAMQTAFTGVIGIFLRVGVEKNK